LIPADKQSVAERLNQLLTAGGSLPIASEVATRFATYVELLERWNARTNLTAIRDREGILSRHFVESILCARALPADVTTLLDFGSGAGFPGIPIALIRNEISITLAESQHKKAAFLREAVRTLDLKTEVHSGRAEDLRRQFDCVTLRAVDRMDRAVAGASELVLPGGFLAILTTTQDAEAIGRNINSLAPFTLLPRIPLQKNTNRILLRAQKSGS
jgi:16S rRNA (guanine527-N7)-methyltransferase